MLSSKKVEITVKIALLLSNYNFFILRWFKKKNKRKYFFPIGSSSYFIILPLNKIKKIIPKCINSQINRIIFFIAWKSVKN